MVKRRGTHIRSGDDFYRYTRKLKKDLGGGISDRELTDGLANFMEQENLTGIFKRRAKRGRRWWL